MKSTVKEETKRYKIGEVSKITGLPISRLRYYDKIGLLSPSYRAQESDYRFYDAYQLEIAYLIEQYQYFGFSLEQIATLLHDPETRLQNEYSIIAERLEEIDKEIVHLKKLHTKLSALKTYNDYLLIENQNREYCLAEMDPQFYVLSDLRMDISYPSHYVSATNERTRMYAIDRKLPWYCADEFYQIPLKNHALSTTGRFCVRFMTNDIFNSKLPIYWESSQYCIKYMAHIHIDDLSTHVCRMLSTAESQGFRPTVGFYYVGELVPAPSNIQKNPLRQIIIPLEKN